MAEQKKSPTKYRPKSVLPKEMPTDKMATCYGFCGKTKRIGEFYKSSADANAVGVIPFCKKCIKELVVNEDGTHDLDKLREILRHPSVDKPFLDKLWQSALDSKQKDKIGFYFKLINGFSGTGLTWADSDDEYKVLPKTEIRRIIKEKENQKEEVKKVINDDIDFQLEGWMIDLFGEGYTSEEYKRMVKKYNFLKENYTESTAMHTEALATYIRYKVKEEIATVDGDSAQAKIWSDLANKASTNAKINPSQLSKADLLGGISTISEISQAVEEAVDVVEILPRFKFRPNDAVDFNIWCYINYARSLEGKPLIDYEDVYKFYDERKSAYIEQYGDPYGIFANDTTEKNRQSIESFIKIKEDEVIEDSTNEEGDVGV